MRKVSVALIVVLSVILFGCHRADGITKLEQERIRSGMNAVAAVAKTMRALEMLKFVAAIGSVAAPLMTIALLAVDIAMMFIKIESPEMQRMKMEFSNVNARLDKFTVQFGEVKRKIDWSTVQITYEKYESTIRIMNQERTAMTAIKDPERLEAAKERYIRKYESDFRVTSNILYQAMSSESVLNNNLFEAARKYTQNHERQTLEFMKGTTQLLLQAFSIDVVYYKLKFNDTAVIDFYKKQIDEKMKNVQANAQRTSDIIRKNWETQMKTDVREQTLLKKGTSNRDFAEYLYRFLDNKFWWRQWFVLSYNEATDSRKHASHTCGGVKYVNVGGRNIVVSSVDKEATRVFSKSWAHDKMRTMRKFRVSSAYGDRVLDAIMKFNDNTKCRPASLMAAVRRSDHRKFVADAWVYTDRSRLHFEPFCVYKCNTDLCWVKKAKCFAVIFFG